MVYQFRQYWGCTILSLKSIINTSLLSKNQPTHQHTQNKSNDKYVLIDIEFKKDFIKKLYPNPKWTDRAFWVIVTNIEDNNENIELHEIVRGSIKYIISNNLPIPTIDWSKWVHISDDWKKISDEWSMGQRDLLQFIRESIRTHQIEGKAKIEDVFLHATENGVTADRFKEAIKRMKRDGSLFEPVEGFYKCI